MKIDDLLAVSGMPGLYTLLANKPNGLIVKSIAGGKQKFCSMRKHQFTPLGSISIYTMEDATPLVDVFRSMESSGEVPSSQASPDELMAYFSRVLPTFDRDRVFPSDIRKVIKWYGFAKDQDLLTSVLADEEE